MNKEEIWEKSRKENKNQDIAELETINGASNIACKVGLAVCLIMSAVDQILYGRLIYTTRAIYFSIIGTLFSVKYIKLRKKHKLALAIFALTFCAVYIIYYIWRFVHFSSLGAGNLL